MLGRVRRWFAASASRTSLRAGAIVGVLSLAATLVRVAKDLALANWFGTHEEADAYLIAMTLPLFVSAVLAGAVNSSLVPEYIRVRQEEGERGAARLLANVLGWAAITLAVVSALLVALGPTLLTAVTAHCGASERQLVSSLYVILVPIVFAGVLSTVMGGVLNARGGFSLPALTPASSSVVPIAALLLLPRHRTIDIVAYGTVVGYLAELVVLGSVLYRAGCLALPEQYRLSEPTRRVLRAFAPMFAGMLVSCASPIIDQFMATQLGEGSVATLAFGGKVPAFMAGLGALAVGAAVLPHFSQLAAERDWLALRHSLWVWVRVVSAVSIPVVVLSMAGAHVVVRVLFERGAFHAADTATTTRVFLAYMPQVPFYILSVLGARVLSALQRNRTIMVIATVNVSVNVAGDYVLMHWLGLPGIALSTSLVYMVSMSLVFLALRDVARPSMEGTGSVPSVG